MSRPTWDMPTLVALVIFAIALVILIAGAIRSNWIKEHCAPTGETSTIYIKAIPHEQREFRCDDGAVRWD